MVRESGHREVSARDRRGAPDVGQTPRPTTADGFDPATTAPVPRPDGRLEAQRTCPRGGSVLRHRARSALGLSRYLSSRNVARAHAAAMATAPITTRTACSRPSSTSGIASPTSTAPSTSIRTTPPQRPSGFTTAIR